VNLLFGVYLLLAIGLPLLLVIALVVRRWLRLRQGLRQRRSASSIRVPVADIMARVAGERAAEAQRTPRLRRSASALPKGRQWPGRDQDVAQRLATMERQVTVPIQRRRYIGTSYGRPRLRS